MNINFNQTIRRAKNEIHKSKNELVLIGSVAAAALLGAVATSKTIDE